MRREVAAWARDHAEIPARLAARKFAARIVSLWEARRLRGATMLFVPTIGGAIEAGTPHLAFHCPACQVAGSVDLRTLSPPRNASHQPNPISVVPAVQSKSTVRKVRRAT